jgi:hypothetical protein
VLRALASQGIFAEIEHGRFELTPLAIPLQTGVPGSMRAWAILTGEEWHWKPWGEILYCVRTGKPAFDHVFNMGTFEYFARNPEAGAVFNEAMTNLLAARLDPVVSAYDFSGMAKIVDVGGGQGSLLTSILKAHPQMRGVLFDLPDVIEDARSLVDEEGISGRCELVSGDFFQSVPVGGEAYILKHIIHDWDNDDAIAILKNCRRAMASSSRLLIVESVIPPGDDPHQGKLGDILMMVVEGGLERTAAEFSQLFNASGFKLTRVISTDSPLSVVEGTPV